MSTAAFLFAICVVAPGAQALLGDTVRRSGAPGSSPLVVRLQRVGGWQGAHFYVGTLSIGQPQPQELQVLFDTASGHVLLPHQVCKSKACQQHRRYSPWKSISATDINTNGKPVQAGTRLLKGQVTRDAVNLEFTQPDLGDGNCTAVLVRDQVCLGTEFKGKACAEVDVLTAINMTDEYFSAMPYDGIVGLGLNGLVQETGCSFFKRLMESNLNLVPQFGISFGAAAGELYLGGHDSARLAAPLQWFPVMHPDDGLWEVAIKTIRLGNVTLDACSGGCRGVIDTGASRLGVQDDHFDKFHAALSLAASPAAAGGCLGPNLEFDLGSLTLSLRVEDYAGAACSPQLGPLNLDSREFKNVFAFGETVLRRYYTAFDWKDKRIGFAPAATRLIRLGGRAPAAPASSNSEENIINV